MFNKHSLKIFNILTWYCIIISTFAFESRLTIFKPQSTMSFFRRRNPSLLNLFRHFERCLENVSRTKEQNTFLEKCIREQVTPKTFDVPLINKDNLACHPVRRLMVQYRVDHASQQLDDARRKLRSASHQLQGRGHPTLLRDLRDSPGSERGWYT